MRVQPRASREGIAGVRGGALVVRLTAPPVGGEANAALVRLLARALRVPPYAVALVRGASAREKLVRVGGVTEAAVRSLAEAGKGRG